MRHPFGTEPAEADSIRSAVADLLNSTVALAVVASRWNAEGWRTHRGNTWTSLSVKRLLRGDRTRRIVGNYSHDALLARLGRDALRPVSSAWKHLHVAVCGTCGAPLKSSKPAGKPQRLMCTKHRTGSDGRRHPQITESLVLERVRDAVVDVVAGQGVRLLDYEPRPVGTISALIGDLHARQGRLRRVIESREPNISRIDLIRRVRESQTDLELLEAEHADRLLLNALQLLEADTRERIAERWDLLSKTDQRLVASRLLRVEVGLGWGASRIRIESQVEA